MTNAGEFLGRPAAAIGQAMARGALDPVAFADALLERIAAQSSPVFLIVTADRARAEAIAARDRLKAGRPLSVLDGVPIAWKDLIDLAGERTTAASALLRDGPVALADAPVVRHATAAGMVNLGKLNLTEFAYSGLGLNPHYGTPLNPHGRDGARAPGGSSSGSGVAVADGLAPIAIGSDTGGSVRIPAAFNGVVGYKSSERRIATDGVFALSRTLDTLGPLAQTVEDCILADHVLRGATGDPTPTRVSPRSLRIHVPQDIVLDDLEDAVAENFEASLARLEAVGVTITRGAVPEFSEAAQLAAEIGTITAAEAYVEHANIVDGPDRDRIDARVAARIDLGRTMTAAGLIRLHRARDAAMKSLAERLNGALLAMPTAPHVAPLIDPLEADVALFHRINLKTLRNTSIGNFLNLPGVAIPNGTGSAGLPTSFLLSATGGADVALLAAALSIETEIRGSAEYKRE